MPAFRNGALQERVVCICEAVAGSKPGCVLGMCREIDLAIVIAGTAGAIALTQPPRMAKRVIGHTEPADA